MAVNLSTTGLIEKVAARHGCRVFRTPVGEANVVETMLAEGCVLGGEGNGGVIYPAVHAGRDALVGIAMVLQALAERGESLAAMVGGAAAGGHGQGQAGGRDPALGRGPAGRPGARARPTCGTA